MQLALQEPWRSILGEDLDPLLGYVRRLYERLVPLRAVPPDLGGEGELERAEALEEELQDLGLAPRRIDSPDPRARGGARPNLLALLPGKRREPRLWIVAHIDTVPEGDLGLWTRPPFRASFEGDYVYGRGVEDDLQGVVEALGLVWLLRRRGVEPGVTLGVALVSDEEAGSRHGLLYLLDQGVWRSPQEDWFLVPDAGSPDGSTVLVAEKHIIWLRVTLRGRQGHASMPHRALNAHRLGMRLNLLLDEVLHSRFTAHDPLYDPPFSTFEPTKKEMNVGNINTIPGTDTVYWDNRVLPAYTPREVVEAFRATAHWFASSTGAEAEVEEIAVDEAGDPTPPSHPLVRGLMDSIAETRGVEPRAKGIGGGTVARYLRRRGYPAAVWMTCEETAHQPDERTRLSYIAADIATLYHLVTSSLPKLLG